MDRSHKHQKLFGLLSLIVLAAMLLSACAPSASAPTQSAPAQVAPTTAPTVAAVAPTMAATSAPAASEPTVSMVTDAKLGKILVDQKGMTLYAFTKDTADKSNCAGGCLKAWPPLTSMGSPKAGDGVDQSKLSTTAMADGSKIVTYNHMPLYYFAKDTKAGDTNGQEVGSVWFAVSPDGAIVQNPASVPATGGTPAATAATAATMAATAAAPSGSTGAGALAVAKDAKLGSILVDGAGRTLYIYTKDTPDKSNCTGGCLKAWPAFTATANVTAGSGVDQSKIGSATLADGSKIVTYNHMPLYYWKGDTKPGDTSGQGVGSVWFVIGPDGNPVGMTASPTGY